VKLAAAALLACGAAGCAASPAPQRPPLTLEAWRTAGTRLAAERAQVGQARTDRISLELTEPRSGRVLRARGAVAIDPPRSLRMILLGPGGTTALDLWVEGDRFRFAVPAIDLVKRGDLRAPPEERRGLPVDFLAWWMLHPLSGTLEWYEDDGGPRFLLHDGTAMIDLKRSGGALAATRTTSAGGKRLDVETLAAPGFGCMPDGAPIRYQQASTGLRVEVRCEGSVPGAPPARALTDPDAVAP
jgi:hypothetical protein